MKELLLTNWSFFRIFRLVLGFIILKDALPHQDWIFVFLGGLLLYQGIFNISCVGGACATDRYSDPKDDGKTIEAAIAENGEAFEEIEITEYKSSDQ